MKRRMMHNKKILLPLFLLSYVFIYQNIINCAQAPAETSGDREAWSGQFGNKAANLMELQKITTELKPIAQRYKLNLDIPEIFPISHQEILDFLSKINTPPQDPSKTETVLQYVINEWESFKTAQQAAKEQQKISSDAKAHLANIRAAITNAFNNTIFAFTKEKRTQDYEKFIQNNSQFLLMARSTGREDSADFANAGGNESVAAVRPDKQTISKAMGIVVESYFSEKSMGQRLAAADKHLYDAPFIPVLLQRMIGEKPVGRQRFVLTATKKPSEIIPISGVMFSQEAEGRTPGVTRIDATWGAGEGVVNGLVAVDTFFVGPTGHIHPLISIKKTRMRANATYKLDQFDNKTEIQKIPVLNSDKCSALAKVARAIQDHYKSPQDIEFVVQENIIYLVQTRPLPGPKVEPSYIKQKYLDTVKDETQNIMCIGAAGGAVQIISNLNQLIITKTLKNALDIFLDHPNKNSIKAVIVSEMSPATSHEATNFRGAAKPVIFMQDSHFINEWLAAGDAKIFIDTQRALIAAYKKSSEFVTDQDAIEKNSWYAHPISEKVSLYLSFLSHLLMEKEQLKKLIQEYENLANRKPKEYSPISKLIDQLKNVKTKEDFLPIIHAIIYQTHNAIAKEINKQKELKKLKKETDPDLVKKLNTLENHFIESFRELIQTFEQLKEQPDTAQKHLQWLYPIVFLNALIRQIPSELFVDDYSLVSILKIEKEEGKTAEKFGLEDEVWRSYYAQYAKVSSQALTDQVRKTWENYIRELRSVTSEKDSTQAGIAMLVYDMTRLGLMPLWLNLIFINEYNKTENNDNIPTITGKLLDNYFESKEEINEIAKTQQLLQKFPINKFSEPASFKKLWETLEKLLNPFTTQEFAAKYDAIPELAKYATLITLTKLIDVLDLSIKELEPSQEYSDKKIKAERFKIMISKSFALFENLTKIPSILNDLNGMCADSFKKVEKPIENYVNHIKDIINFIPADPSKLKPSHSFNVAGASLGSHATWTRSIGSGDVFRPAEQEAQGLTLDDMFTLAHQNSLIVTGLLYSKTNIAKMRVPGLVSVLNEEARRFEAVLPLEGSANLLKSSFIGFNISPTAIDANLSEITYFYNMPAKNHSNTFQVIYNQANKQTSLDIQFIGDARGRWNQLARWSVIFSMTSKIQMKKDPEIDTTRGLLKLSFILKKQDEVYELFDFIKELIAATATMDQQEESTIYTVLDKVLEQDVEQEFKDNIITYIEKTTKPIEIKSMIPLVITSLYNRSDIVDAIFKKIITLIKETTEYEARDIVETIAKSFQTISQNLAEKDGKHVYATTLFADNILMVIEQLLGKISHTNNEKYFLSSTIFSSILAKANPETNDLYKKYLEQHIDDTRWQFQYITSKILSSLLSLRKPPTRTVEEWEKYTEFVKKAIDKGDPIVLDSLLNLLPKLVRNKYGQDLVIPLIRKATTYVELDLTNLIDLISLIRVAQLEKLEPEKCKELVEKITKMKYLSWDNDVVSVLISLVKNTNDPQFIKQVPKDTLNVLLLNLDTDGIRTLTNTFESISSFISNLRNNNMLDEDELKPVIKNIVNKFKIIYENKDEYIREQLQYIAKNFDVILKTPIDEYLSEEEATAASQIQAAFRSKKERDASIAADPIKQKLITIRTNLAGLRDELTLINNSLGKLKTTLSK